MTAQINGEHLDFDLILKRSTTGSNLLVRHGHIGQSEHTE